MKTDACPPMETPRLSTAGAVAGVSPAARRRPPSGPIASEDLFAGATEVQISHRGSLYRLKQTALGKLILTK